ncbi:hypothetical protein BM1_06185 [Bipolaris maydis]|nr:hypothetical protein BM1_06185 [Bipolaris maydis]KAJ6279098.1 hypothetical protein J3E71DRAFT_368536 [Bipolaris maydis]
MPPPTGIRLRDSCQSCAASKTKCSKDKPQCARCAKRGTKCEYLVTQRTGRKALARRDSDAKEQSSDAGVRRKSLSRSTTTATNTTTTTTTSSSSMYDTPDIHMSGCVEAQDGAADMYMIEPGLETFDADTAGSMLPEMSTVHDDYFSLLVPDVDTLALDQVYDTSSATDAAASDVLAQPLLGTSSGMPHGTAAYAAYTQGNNLAAAGHSSRDPPQQPDLGMLLDAACLPGGPTQTGEQTGQLLSEMQTPYYQTAMDHAAASQQQHEGLTMALQLMQHLCCLTDTSSANSMPVMGGAPRPPPLRLRSLMDKCSKATATISAILHGDSSHDAYFLAVVCLTMSKVLDAYVTASRTLGTPTTTTSTADYDRRKSRSSSASSSSSSSPSVLSSPARPDSARSNRSSGSVSPPVVLQGDPKAVQQLLDELYHVRASMDLLGAKIAAVAPASCSVFASGLSFSAETLSRLYEEQRRRLKCISLYLINSLKAFWVEETSF